MEQPDGYAVRTQEGDLGLAAQKGSLRDLSDRIGGQIHHLI